MPENRFDAKIIGEFLNLGRSLAEAPMKVSVPHEVKIGSTQFDVAYKEDKIRLLHFKPHQSRLKHHYLSHMQLLIDITFLILTQRKVGLEICLSRDLIFI